MRHILLSAIALVTVAACGAEIETTDGIKTTDPLYAEVQTQCGEDAVILKAVDVASDEILCCLNYSLFVPSVHCMSASGAAVTNPNSLSKLVEVSKAAKVQSKKKK